MFVSPSSGAKNNNNIISTSKENSNNIPVQQKQVKQQQQQKHSNQDLMALAKPEPLTQSQLLQAMSYLIKNDPGFVKKLHEAYLKSFTEMVSL